MNRDKIEEKIQEKGLTAPRLTPAYVKHLTENSEAEYFIAHDVVTVCVLKLPNGFSVVGHSAPLFADNFNEELGRDIAKQKAADQIWALEGYRVKCEDQK